MSKWSVTNLTARSSLKICHILSPTNMSPKGALIVAAGPIFNIILAILIFTFGLYFTGLPSIRAIVRSIDSDSPAQSTGILEGDVIRAIDDMPVDNWRDIDRIVDESQGRQLDFTIERDGRLSHHNLTPVKMQAKNLFGDDVDYFDTGLKGYFEPQAVVDNAVPGMPAAAAGLRKGDRIISIDGRPIDKWETMQEMVSGSKGKTLSFEISRGDEIIEIEITPVEVVEKDRIGTKQHIYQIGIQRMNIVIPEEDQVVIELGLSGAFIRGVSESWNMVYATGYFFVKLAQRQVPASAIGGPIRIAQMAHQEYEQGLLRLLYFVAIVSVNLAVLNLLPIPVLDGGHLFFFLIEAIQGRPVSVRVRETAQQIGIILLVMLMIFVFYNDISLTFFK